MRSFERIRGKTPDLSRAGRFPPWILAFLLTGCPLSSLDVPQGLGTTTTSMATVGCMAAKECDDGNPCTEDTCESGVCSYSNATDGTPCPDSSACNGDETCDGHGVCRAGKAKSIDDGDPCTLDVCDPKSGDVTHPTSPACGAWAALPAANAPAARSNHTAVWTGTEMIVWGGQVAKDVDPALVTATGARFDPAKNAWTPMSTSGAPAPRHSHTAVWTGSKMIVWGGYGASSYETGGGAYDPATDTWTALSTSGVPQGRTQHTAVWTGSEMIVWGGLHMSALGDGARYSLDKDTWTALPMGPSQRANHGAVFTGTQMIVWGGNDLFDWHKDGEYLDPAADPASAWVGPTATMDAPAAREGMITVWSGTQMIVWGGFDGGKYLDSGGALDPSAPNGGAWTALTQTGAPAARQKATGLWAGSQLMVWGGCGMDACSKTFGDGAFWVPGANGGMWEAIPEGKVAAPRTLATAVWTGTQVIVWGGRDASGKYLGDGSISKP
jgi:hypothetical protein